jgi:PAS domain S-box-containing protein
MSWEDPQFGQKSIPPCMAEMTLSEYLDEKKPHISYKGSMRAPRHMIRLLIFDQFEEVFFAHPQHWQERRKYFQQLGDALETDPLTKAVFVLREDYIAELDPFSDEIPDAFGMRFRLERLNRDAALRAVKGPMEQTGRRFVKGVAERLVHDMAVERVQTGKKVIDIPGEYVEPVQLQIVCHKLWETNTTEISSVNLRHKVSGYLSDFYSDVVRQTAQHQSFNEQHIRDACQQYLITSIGTRNKVYQDEWAQAIPEPIIHELKERYLVYSQYSMGTTWYELTHDLFVNAIIESNSRVFEERARENQKQGELKAKAQRAEEAIQRTSGDAALENPREVFLALMEHIRKDIPFDLCTISMLSRDSKYSRLLFQHPEVEALKQLSRWYLLPEDPWLFNHNVSVQEVRNILARYAPKTPRQKEQKDLFARQGYFSVMRYPVIRGSRIVASMSLWSRTHQYAEWDKQLFKALPVEAALLTALYYEETDELRFRIELLKDLVACSNNKEVAKMLVERIGLHYGWHHVGMYRVDEARGEFSLISEWHVAEVSDVSTLKSTYSAKMEGGILKSAYEGGDQNVPPVGGHSELCMRIMADEKVVGLLNIKDLRDSAFLVDEIKVLRDLLDVTGKVLERVRIANLIRATFEATMTAVLVVDGSGVISKANPSGASLLGYSTGEIEGSRVDRFLPEGNHLKRLIEQCNLAPEETILRHRNGHRIKVLLSGSRLGGESSAMVISAQPIRELGTKLAA